MVPQPSTPDVLGNLGWNKLRISLGCQYEPSKFDLANEPLETSVIARFLFKALNFRSSHGKIRLYRPIGSVWFCISIHVLLVMSQFSFTVFTGLLAVI